MNTSGSIMPFLCDTIDKSVVRNEWQKWLRSLKLYLDAEDITDAKKKKSKLMHLGGVQLQEVIYSLPGAIVEEGDVFDVLVKKLDEYFSPKRNSTFERHLFRSIKPENGEDFKKFILRVRQQASKCQFGENKQDVININIKDKIIDKWASLDLRKRLLEKEYALDEVLEMCNIHEQINHQSDSMASSSQLMGITGINKVQSNQVKSFDGSCYRCGKNGHDGRSLRCPARNMNCNKCSLKGHFAIKCRTGLGKRKFNENDYSSNKRVKNAFSNVRYIDKCEENDNDCKEGISVNNCFKISEDQSVSSPNIPCYIGGVKLDMIIDSGSHFNLISESDWILLENKKATIWNVRTKSDKQFRAYAVDDILKIKYVFEGVVGILKSSNLISTFYVIENGTQSLLGLETAIK